MAFYGVPVKQIALMAILFLAISSLQPLDTGDSTVIVLIVSIAASFPAFRYYRKTFCKPVVVWDVHGVLMKGDMATEDMTEIENTRALIQRVRENHYVAAFTNMNNELFEIYGPKFGLPGLYDEIYTSGMLKMKKPESAAFEKVLRGLGVKAKNVVFLDDVAANVESAKKMGMRGIVFKTPEQAAGELKKFGVNC